MPALFESAADRQSYLDALGEPVTYTPLAGAAKTINGIFEKESETHPVFDNNLEVIGFKPGIQCATVDLTDTVQGGAIVADGTTYTITEVLPDGTGMTDLGLEEA